MTMDLQPNLSGPTLDLRPLRADDRDALYRAASDPQIWAQHPVPDRYQRDSFDSYFDEALASGGALVVLDRATGTHIGSSRYSTKYVNDREIEIGWTFLSASHWGGAANRELKRLMITHALGFFDTVIFRIGEHNLRSRRAMEKIGGTLLDRTQVLDMPSGPVLYVMYSITADAFAALPLSRAP
jgi:RimJ/RimL family protein N-acetyltransferase